MEQWSGDRLSLQRLMIAWSEYLRAEDQMKTARDAMTMSLGGAVSCLKYQGPQDVNLINTPCEFSVALHDNNRPTIFIIERWDNTGAAHQIVMQRDGGGRFNMSEIT